LLSLTFPALGNNSAWNYRFFVIEHQEHNLAQEIEYAIQFIEKAPNNRSPWNYLLGYASFFICKFFTQIQKHS
jgi:hypothetical protein